MGSIPRIVEGFAVGSLRDGRVSGHWTGSCAVECGEHLLWGYGRFLVRGNDL